MLRNRASASTVLLIVFGFGSERSSAKYRRRSANSRPVAACPFIFRSRSLCSDRSRNSGCGARPVIFRSNALISPEIPGHYFTREIEPRQDRRLVCRPTQGINGQRLSTIPDCCAFVKLDDELLSAEAHAVGRCLVLLCMQETPDGPG